MRYASVLMPQEAIPTKANRQQIIEIARSWGPRRDDAGKPIPGTGTPWRHQGNTKHLGADCEGFIEGVFREGGYVEVIEIVRNYRRREDGSLMLALLQESLDFVAGSLDREPVDMSLALPADIFAFGDESLRMPDRPRHLGIYSEQRTDGVHYVIHMGDEQHGLVEHRLDLRWLRRVHSVWRVRGIDG
ncbi:MAG: hypothetical protein AABN95_16155 [Acidobacteriota bacterium]